MKKQIVAILAVGALAACAQRNAPVETGGEVFAGWQETRATSFRSGDTLTFRFAGAPELNATLRVNSDGSVSFPLAGSVRVVGLKRPAVARSVEKAFDSELKEPQVAVNAKAYSPRRVYVGGAVKNARGVEFRPDDGALGAAEAVLKAGGFSRGAKPSQVAVIRRAPDGKPMLRAVDVDASLSGRARAAGPALRHGDVVFVPETRLSEAAEWFKHNVKAFVDFRFGWSQSVN